MESHPGLGELLYRNNYADEREAEDILGEVTNIALVAAKHNFVSVHDAQRYIDKEVKPYINDQFPEVVLEATGEGILYPASNITRSSDGDFNSFNFLGLKPSVITDPPAKGYFHKFEAKIHEEIDEVNIAVRAMIRMPYFSDNHPLSEYMEVRSRNCAVVPLNDTASIGAYRLAQLRHVKWLLATSFHPTLANKLVDLMCDIDKELLNEEKVNKPLAKLNYLHHAGHVAGEMLKSAGEDRDKRCEVIELLKNSTTLINRPILFTVNQPFFRRIVVGEQTEKLCSWELSKMEPESKLSGTVIDIVECHETELDFPLDDDTPHLVILTPSLNAPKQKYNYVPLTQVSQFHF